MHKRWIYLNVETVADESALPLLAEPLPRKGTKDEAKISAQIEAKREAQLAAMSLDPYACGVACVAWTTHADAGFVNCFSLDGFNESYMLRLLAKDVAQFRPIIGYNSRTFDMVVLATRARLLGIDWPILETRPFGNTDQIDIYEELTMHGLAEKGSLNRTLHTMAARHGIAINDDVRGHQIGALVAAGEWDKVRHHCANNVRLTVALAQRLGVLATAREEVEA